MLKKSITLTLALIMIAAAQVSLAATYTVDNVHSQVHFKVPHLMIFKCPWSIQRLQRHHRS